jgi:hypothetical protein
MLTISKIITYKPVEKPPTRSSNEAKREYRRLNGLCSQCGGVRPCERCTNLSRNRKSRLLAKARSK